MASEQDFARPGEERSLHTLVRDPIRAEVMPLVAEAIKTDRRRAIKDLEVVSPFRNRAHRHHRSPMKDATAAVIFNQKGRLAPLVDEYEVSPQSRDQQIADLQAELHSALRRISSGSHPFASAIALSPT